jgi:hypothetical protein
VREAVGVAAYHAGDYAEAARELRAYRRMSGDEGYRAVLADCERALGRPEVALRLVREALDQGVDDEETTELRLVEAGARADVGELPAALLVLEDVLGGRPRPDALDLTDDSVLRLAAAYADLLETAGRAEDAERWQDAVAAARPDEDVEFGEDFLSEEQGLPEIPGAGEAEVPTVDDAGDDLGDDAGHSVDDAGYSVDDVGHSVDDGGEALELPGISDADIEAEVAELLGETTDGPVGEEPEPDAAG